MTTSPVRRSSRARRPATTIYDEAAKKELERRQSMENQKDDDDDDDDDNDSDNGDGDDDEM